METGKGAGGGGTRDLEMQLRELRCKTQAQEQCIVQYKLETEKLLSRTDGDAPSDAMHGMMKVWLRDARQQSEDLRRLFEESKAIAAETLAASKREMGSKITKLQLQVVQLEADVTDAVKGRTGAEEAAERLRHELATAKRDQDLLRSELSTSSSELSGKLTVRQNVTKGEICKLSAEVFTLQQNLMEQAQKSAEAEKKGSVSYQQDLLSLNSLLERSQEMRERDRAAFAAALEVANADLRDKEAALQETQEILRSAMHQLAESRRSTADLSQHVTKVENTLTSNEVEAAERVVRAARMRTNAILVRAVTHGWRMIARPAHDISFQVRVIHDKRSNSKMLAIWRFKVFVQHRDLRKINALQQRWNAGRILSNYLKWRHYSRVKHHLELVSCRIFVRVCKSTRSSVFHDWRLKSCSAGALRRQQLRAAAHWDRTCMRRALRVMLTASAESKWRLVQGQRLVTRVFRRQSSRVLLAWNCLIRYWQESVILFNAQKSSYRSHWAVGASFGAWVSVCASPSTAKIITLRIANTQQRRRNMGLFFCAWQLHTSTRKQSRLKTTRASLHVKYVRKQRTTHRMRMYVCFCKGLALRRTRIAGKWARSLVTQFMQMWSEMRMRQKMLSIQDHRCKVKSVRIHLTQVIRQWRDGVVEARLVKVSKHKAESKYVLKRTVAAFRCFADNRIETRALRKKAFSVAQKRLMKLCAWSLSAWMNCNAEYHHRSKQDLAVISRRNMLALSRLRKCTQWWIECSHRNKVLARLARCIAFKCAHTLSRERLHAWRVLQQIRKRRSALVLLLQTRKRAVGIMMSLDAWSHYVYLECLQTSNKKECQRLSAEVMLARSELEVALSKEADSEEQLHQLHQVRIPALVSENMAVTEKLELVQMELEAKQAEALSTKTQYVLSFVLALVVRSSVAILLNQLLQNPAGS